MVLVPKRINEVLTVILEVFTAQGYEGKKNGRSHFVEVNIDGIVFGLKYGAARESVEYYALRDGVKTNSLALRLWKELEKEIFCFYSFDDDNTIITSQEVMQWDVETNELTERYAVRLLSVFQRVAAECALNSEAAAQQ